MKAMKVFNIRSHVGVQVGPQVLTSLDSEKNKFVMARRDGGIWIYEDKPEQKFGYFVTDGSYCSAKVSIEDCKRMIEGHEDSEASPPKASKAKS